MYSNYFLNKITLVTGAGSGIGRELCLKLAEGGATVICTDIDPAKAAETVELTRKPTKATSIKLDVTQLSEVESVMAGIVTQYGRLDLVFNNSGIAISGEMRDISMGDWKRVIDVNFYGVLYGSQTAYRHMLKQGYGQIINTASGAGLMEYLVLMAPYSVTKHAVVNYTKILRAEAKTLGIKANVVCPGFISTDIGKNATYSNAKQNWNENTLNEVAKGISVDKAVEHILKGVAANREMIVFPMQIRLILPLTRLFKPLYKIVIQKLLKGYREKYRGN
jgi:NAD(P)-dependent dehydrogenase (short-subunit alcohol dehydrogenase family)